MINRKCCYIFFLCIVGTIWSGFFEDAANWIEDTAQETIDTVEEIGQDVKDELVDAGKKAWNEIKEEYEKIEREFEKAKERLDKLTDKLENELKKIKGDLKNAIQEVEDFGEDVVDEITEAIEKLDPNFLQNIFKNLNVKRFYFHGSTKEIADGTFPHVVVVTGVGDDIKCAEFQFDARNPVQSVHAINKELFHMLVTNKDMPCKDMPEPVCP